MSIKKNKLRNGKTITYKLKFIDSFRFMSRKLPNFVDNSSEIYKKECKECKERKRSKQYVNLSGLKVINYLANANNVKKKVKTNQLVN